MDVIKPYEFIRFGAMDVTKPYKFIGFGAVFAGTVSGIVCCLKAGFMTASG